jgi:hypothetical protein
MGKDTREKIIAILEIVTALGLALFWLGFFTVGLAPENPPECYFAYENSFPLADLILAGGLLAAGVMTLKGRPAAGRITLACAGALMFLGVLDFSFNVQSGVYTLSVMDLLLNGFINLWCAGFGLSLLILAAD